MRFNVSGKALQAKLQAVSKVISSKNSMSILDNFLLRVRDNTLYIIGSDQETTMSASLEVMDCEGEGEVAVLAKRLLDVVKEVNNQPLKFYVNDDTKEIDLTFNNGHFNFMGIDAAEYPRKRPHADDSETFSLPADVITDGLESTLFAVSLETIRPIMMGIYWDIEPERITFVSSDTHKLVKYESSAVQPGVTTSFILPAKPAGIIKGLLSADEEMVEITRDEVSATFRFGDYSISTRFIKGKYPDYRRVFPKENPFQLIVSREGMLNAVRRVALFASKASGLVKFNLQPTEILMAAQDLDYSTSAEERLECEYRGNSMTIGFNSEYMVEVLANLKCDEVVVDLADPARPGLFRPLEKKDGIDIVMLQMPMQVVE